MEHPIYSNALPNTLHGSPSALGDAFEEIWEAANQRQIGATEIQRRLDIFRVGDILYSP